MKGWKTLLAAGAVALTGFLASPEFTAWVAEHFAEAAGLVGALIAALRFMTTGPVFNKPE